MPIYELGYRHWEGELCNPLHRMWAITRTGIALGFRSKMLLRLLIFAWMPLLYFAPLFFAIGYATDPERAAAGDNVWTQFVQGFLGSEIANRLLQDPESVRRAAWAIAFHYFFSYTQAWLTMLVVAIIGPPLIAQDVRRKAFLLYFSRPITRWEYLGGKASVMLFFVFVVTLFPAIVLYAISIAFSPSLSALFQTGTTIFQIVAVAAVIAIPATLVVLSLSSLTEDSRYATFGWISLWLVGEVSYRILSNIPQLADHRWIFLLSVRKTTSVLIEAIFDVVRQIRALGRSDAVNRVLEQVQTPYPPWLGLVFLTALSLVCLCVVFRRISKPMRI
ncbi:MAG: ABC transporter permease subunit [Planctomycetes bacterium]|nr:ABC transporter permease subunit [Planctomycetota bacterium]